MVGSENPSDPVVTSDPSGAHFIRDAHYLVSLDVGCPLAIVLTPRQLQLLWSDCPTSPNSTAVAEDHGRELHGCHFSCKLSAVVRCSAKGVAWLLLRRLGEFHTACRSPARLLFDSARLEHPGDRSQRVEKYSGVKRDKRVHQR